jgi:hypothetical protein
LCGGRTRVTPLNSLRLFVHCRSSKTFPFLALVPSLGGILGKAIYMKLDPLQIRTGTYIKSSRIFIP